jgi:hypothetical protein
VATATDPPFARALRRALRDHEHIELALQDAILATLRVSGRVVTGATVVQRFAEFRAAVAADASFDLDSEDDSWALYEHISDGVLAAPERAPRRFWARAGMTAYPDIVTLQDSVRSQFVDLHLISDDRQDWFYVLAHTSVGAGYDTGASRASRRAGRREILSFVNDAGGWLSNPGWVETSLTGADLVWLRGGAAARGAVPARQVALADAATDDVTRLSPPRSTTPWPWRALHLWP